MSERHVVMRWNKLSSFEGPLNSLASDWQVTPPRRVDPA
jgi:hypothetical protein